jgi:MarR family transcriptional regulator, organic hydroperoxide resistance regulator
MKMRPEGTEIRGENLGKVAIDLLSVPALINRIIRRKLVMNTLADAEGDLKLLHFEIMRVLKLEGTMHPSKIGEKLLIAKAQMTHLIDKLVEVGFVTREMDSIDRRTFNLTITEKGRRVLDEADNMVINAVSDVMASLSEKELESLSYTLRAMRDILFKLQ